MHNAECRPTTNTAASASYLDCYGRSCWQVSRPGLGVLSDRQPRVVQGDPADHQHLASPSHRADLEVPGMHIILLNRLSCLCICAICLLSNIKSLCFVLNAL